MGFGFTSGFSAPFFGGSTRTATSVGVPSPWHVALGGHPYMVAMTNDAVEKWGVRYEVNSVPLLRSQSDQSDTPSEQSISPSLLWRRTAESFHLGSGQQRYDRKSSSPYRFWKSTGVDPWTEGELKLLPNCLELDSAGIAGPVYGSVAGSLYYVIATNSIRRFSSADLTGGFPTGTISATITGVTAGFVPNSVATDGNTTWIAYGSHGIWKTDVSITTAASWLTGTCSVVGYAKGRIVFGDGAGALWTAAPSVAGGTAISATTAVMATPSSAWQWTAIGEGPNCIYATGYSGNMGGVYAITVKSDGTGLNVPFLAATLPSGEIPRAVYSYLGNVVIGTDKGVRMAIADANSNLTLGSLIPTGSPVYDFEGQDRFVYFTWTNYDSISTGLGRLDMRNFTSPLTPAYASDLMAQPESGTLSYVPTQGTIRTVGTWLGKRVLTRDSDFPGGFAPASLVAFVEVPITVLLGSIDLGAVAYGIGDPKIAVTMTVGHDPLVGSVTLYLSADNNEYMALGNNHAQSSSSSSFSANHATGESFNMALVISRQFIALNDVTLTSGGAGVPFPPFAPPPVVPTGTVIDYGDGTQGPVVHAVTLRSLPQPSRILEYKVPLMMSRNVVPTRGSAKYVDVGGERAYLEGLHRSQQMFTYQEGTTSTLVTMSELNFIPMKFPDGGLPAEGIFVVTLTEVA